jgi:DNA-binding transcriptional LysR family regulator
MVAAGIGIAVMPEVAARRCAKSMRIGLVRIRDPWASRKLVICARSFKALPRRQSNWSSTCERLRRDARFVVPAPLSRWFW